MLSARLQFVAALFTILLLAQPAKAQFAGTASGSMASVSHSVCSRTPQVQQAIYQALAAQGFNLGCDEISWHLGLITELNLSLRDIIALQVFDFEGLLNVVTLDLSHNGLVTLPVGLFASTPNLASLSLASNRLTTLDSLLPATSRKLEFLDISSNYISSLSVDLAVNLVRLYALKTGGNPLDHNDDRINELATSMSYARGQLWTYRWTDHLRDSGIFCAESSRLILMASVGSTDWLAERRRIQAHRLQRRREAAYNSPSAAIAGSPAPLVQSSGGSRQRRSRQPRLGEPGRPQFGAESGGGGFMEAF